MKVHYVSGSRADFGLMEICLKALDEHPEIELGLVLTGQHLLEEYGSTESAVVNSGLIILERIRVELSGSSGSEMGRALADQLHGFVRVWEDNRPDLVIVLGDRGEMLAATLAAVHLGLHVAHIHGGERSGTIDESFRHAISKLAHFHFATSEDAADRLVKMGEAPEFIWNIGAPGLVGIQEQATTNTDLFGESFELSGSGPKVLFCFHPVVQEADEAAWQVDQILQLLLDAGAYGVLLKPNSDAGSSSIELVLSKLTQAINHRRFAILDHLQREEYLQCLEQADVLVGNSSSGIIESASLSTPCLNVGNRQNGRLRNTNVVDCPQFDSDLLYRAFQEALQLTGPFENKFGDGKTHTRLSEIIPALPLSPRVLSKINSY